MIIKEITIENFRSYYGINTIKFNDGLVIFIGDNGDGKTTFFEALEWLFDTTSQKLDKQLISEKKISELPEFESDVLRVTMTFDHDGEKILEKSFQFSKESNNEIKVSDFQFKGFENNGSERIPIQGGRLLDRCFEAAIRKYCLFKGEENLNVFNNPDALQYLIDTFSNISQFAPYCSEDEHNLGFTEYAETLSNKAFEKAMKSDSQNSHQEKELSAKLNDVRKELSDIRKRLRSNRENSANYSSKLSELENSKEASSLLKDINDRLKAFKDKKYQNDRHINEDYSIKLLDDMWILCDFSSTFNEFQEKVSIFSKEKRRLEREEDKIKGKKELAKEIAEGIIPLSPNVPDKISMQEMIKDQFCKVCGREAEEGSDAHNFMIHKLQELLDSQQPKNEIEKPLFSNNFLKELEQKSNHLEYDQSDINNLLNTIKDYIEFNEARKLESSKFQESINKDEDNKRKLLAQNDRLTEEQLQNSYQNINNWWNNKSDADNQITILENELSRKEKELEEYQERYNNLAKGSFADTYRKIHSALNKIKNAFINAKDKNTQDFLNLLEERANKYLEKLNIDGFFGIIRIIEIDKKNTKITLVDKNGTFISSPNQALKTTMYMSVLFAVSDLTAIKRENDYPLIFDAPTSSFSPQKESDFFKIISNINKQCIIFTKSFLTEDGKLDNLKIESQNCQIYRIEKLRPFDNLDLSTIQTKITPIK
ncbi:MULTISPECIES: AAA family ATPase [Sphingobacterium]|uniref:AAA family ATPase n=1 Tax=Sphingobacterium TaxID=28453 RepID=UPI00104ADF5F|nr:MULTISPECIES: AAA family ATPase [Sphingobacterium]MCW2260112.1 DNA sulfur modification protein DndD [Sphingobacterium kitahiroshimense]TCR11097.1 DNA sulfur modification protein DndD [Sphingobacterium sp. JUb78]